jgi:hypothetical protein
MRGVMISIERIKLESRVTRPNQDEAIYVQGIIGRFSSTQRLKEKKMPGKIQLVNQYILIFYNIPLVDRLCL